VGKISGASGGLEETKNDEEMRNAAETRVSTS
jgi:hypothetical protein